MKVKLFHLYCQVIKGKSRLLPSPAWWDRYYSMMEETVFVHVWWKDAFVYENMSWFRKVSIYG